MSSLFQIFTDAMLDDNLEFQEGSKVHQEYKKEILDQVNRNSTDYCEIYIELTMIYIRYTESTEYYKDISPVFPPKNKDKILFILTALIANLSELISVLFANTIKHSSDLIQSFLEEDIIKDTTLLDIIYSTDQSKAPRQCFETSLIEFCELVSYLKQLIRSQKILKKDLEFFYASAVYFGYNHHPPSNTFWQKTLNKLESLLEYYKCDLYEETKITSLSLFSVYRIFQYFSNTPKSYLKEISDSISNIFTSIIENLSQDLSFLEHSLTTKAFSQTSLILLKKNYLILHNIFKTSQLNWNVNSKSFKSNVFKQCLSYKHLIILLKS